MWNGRRRTLRARCAHRRRRVRSVEPYPRSISATAALLFRHRITPTQLYIEHMFVCQAERPAEQALVQRDEPFDMPSIEKRCGPQARRLSAVASRRQPIRAKAAAKAAAFGVDQIAAHAEHVAILRRVGGDHRQARPPAPRPEPSPVSRWCSASGRRRHWHRDRASSARGTAQESAYGRDAQAFAR